MDRRLALVRRPSPSLADGLVTHIERAPVDLDLALRQWRAYVDAFTEHGWEVVEAPASDAHPDGVFIEDPVFVHGDLAVLMRPGAEERRGETEGLADLLAARGYRIAAIEAPGTIDGGDALTHGDQVWVGLGGRTNQAGVDQLAALLSELGATVTGVPVTKVLHLKSAVTALPDGTVIGHEPLVDDPGAWPRFLAVPEEQGAHVVLLGDDRVLMSAAAPESAALLAARGLDVVTVDITEFEKLEGCVTCLSVRLRGAPA
ncbi:N(G),N(G)-dimethylarginine dimethylaminohydrolase [Nocardioides sp. zg-1308]|uniref:dimethylargininase n=1 Tax=Nocardioides sp. zg-1308 TaxID=2736253 RepID=UPI0015544E5A|nr:dimethylargininase [Nocardioides sp. zg-1308]NPD04259.1 N(G),N(G)-dimethylarginine dimethylaminohydrolase [Nocardioides sp. zg-1308]